MIEEKKGKEEKERQYIKVYKDFMDKNKYDCRDQFVLFLLKGFAHQRFGGVTIGGVDSILKILGFTTTSRNKKSIKESIESLIEYGFIKMYEDYSCTIEETEVKHWNTYFFQVKDDIFQDGYFTKVYYDDFNKFLKMDEKNKMKVFLVYYNIIARIFDIESSDKYTLPNIEEISSQTGINRKTIPKYLKSLMENKILYYKEFISRNGMKKNVYSRWEDRDKLEIFLQRAESEAGQLPRKENK